MSSHNHAWKIDKNIESCDCGEVRQRVYMCDHSIHPFVVEEPAKMLVCKCGQNGHCPVCGYGWGTMPCECTPTPYIKLYPVSDWRLSLE